MISKIYGQIFKKSPWDDLEQEENIFTKKRKKDQFNFDNFQFNFSFKMVLLVLVALFALWLSSGVYEIKEGQQAVVMRFLNIIGLLCLV